MSLRANRGKAAPARRSLDERPSAPTSQETYPERNCLEFRGIRNMAADVPFAITLSLLALTALMSSAKLGRAEPEPTNHTPALTEPSSETDEPLEIEARAAPLRHALDDPTVASTVISGADLERPGTSSADVLARVPGVQVNRTGAQSDLATASIRGAG